MQEAIKLARQTLKKYLRGERVNPYHPQDITLKQKVGCFITLRTKKNHQLRGCIGQFEPDKPLWQVVQTMAIAAATQDCRFPPISFNELGNILIEISVLTPKKKIDDWRKIELGKHGVVIQRGLQSGTFLPQVATETGWDLPTFLGELCSKKAGLPRESYKDPKTEIYTFEAKIFEEK